MRFNKLIFALSLIILTSVYGFSQCIEMPLWDGAIPNYQETSEKEAFESTNILRYTSVVKPDIRVFFPAKNNQTGQAIIICPGGGYGVLAYDWEGTDIAKWFNSHGVVALVLKYRLPQGKSNIVSYKSPLLDAQRAIRVCRANAKKWNIDSQKIGVIGFSAGGHLASTLGTHFNESFAEPTDSIDLLSARPDFMALIYPVITFKDDYTHQGSRNNLLGQYQSDEMIKFFSNEEHVDSTTPPAFIVHSADDRIVPVQNSIQFYEALINHHIKAEMHLYPNGGHGYSLSINQGYIQSWPDRLSDWLRSFE